MDYEIDIICELVSKNQITAPTFKEVETAINGIKKGKAAHIFGLTVENFIYGGNELTSFIHSIICAIFKTGKVPNSVKTGILSSVFKNKGETINVKNYRGITVLPVVCKIIDSILKLRIRKKSDPIQCTLQRGFTEKSEYLNATFILEEARRESWDENNPFIIVMLDAVCIRCRST